MRLWNFATSFLSAVVDSLGIEKLAAYVPRVAIAGCSLVGTRPVADTPGKAPDIHSFVGQQSDIPHYAAAQ